MIIIFHGAINQKIRKIPYFPPHLPALLDCHQLSVADPTLALNGNLAAGWYIGGENLPLQATMPAVIESISKLFGVGRRIYLGGSAGGFAALYYSALDSGSICIAVNPQTNLLRYRREATDVYRKYAWPKTRTLAEIGESVVLDLPSFYAKGFDNLVIYLQSSGDMAHFAGQMPELFNVAIRKRDNIILDCGYRGVPGHSNSIPPKYYYPWVKSAVASNWSDRQDILDTHFALTNIELKVEERKSIEVCNNISESDIQLADRLRDYQLRKPMES
jgi:hypothetical protein